VKRPRRAADEGDEAENLRWVLVQLAQPAPHPIGCASWSEVASHFEEELNRRIALAREALPKELRPRRRQVPKMERQAAPRLRWSPPDG